MQSKWDNGECNVCGSKWSKGTEIFKVEYPDSTNTHWCSNSNCKQDGLEKQQGQSSKVPATPPSKSGEEFYLNTKIPTKLVDFHRDVFAFAVEEATKVYPVESIKIPDSDKIRDVNLKDRMILAQVFYKGMMHFE